MAARKRRRQKARRGGPAQQPQGPQAVTRPVIGTAGRVPKAAQPAPTEPMFLHINRLVEKEQPGSEEELNALVSRFITPGRRPEFPEPDEPWHKAQDLAYEGWEETSARKRASVAQRALDISADTPDAYLLLAHDAEDWADAEHRCIQARDAAKRLLDPIDDFDGEFWGVALTRPFMRATFALGYARWQQAEREDARSHFEHLMELNPRDNQGVRYPLVAIYLELDDERKARRLMDDFFKDPLCHWSYNRALWQFRRRGDHPNSRKHLDNAQSENPSVIPLLLGEERVDSWEYDMVAPGEETEALEYVQLYKNAWEMVPDALAWLKQW